jgi:hypothetical protein
VGRLRANTLPDDDAQTTFMSRASVPQLPPSKRRPPIFTEERTRVDFPRPTDDGERTIVAPLSFPKTSRATFVMPTVPRPSSIPTPTAMKPAARPSQPPPLPVRARSEAPPTVIAPPPPSATRVVIDTPAPVVIPQPASSSPAVVMDVSPASVPPPAPGLLRSREPMILVAAALGVLGMIFTMGIVVGLVFSLHSPDVADASSAPRALAAGGVVAATSEALPLKVAPAKTPPAPGLADTLAGVKANEEPVAIAAAQAPKPAPAPVAQVAAPSPRPRPAVVAMATTAPRPAPVAKRQRGSDPDMDAASAASDLAKAQLEASLR